MDKQSMSMAASQPASNINPRLIIVMGVSGAGKTTIAKKLAMVLDTSFLDADDYHPLENIAKMSNAIALTDEDRWPWLENFAQHMANEKGIVIGACSSLKKTYRKHITKSANEPVRFIYLNGSKKLIRQRVSSRKDHFMPGKLLDSQFNDLEQPSPEELADIIDISPNPEKIIENILIRLSRSTDNHH